MSLGYCHVVNFELSEWHLIQKLPTKRKVVMLLIFNLPGDSKYKIHNMTLPLTPFASTINILI